MIVCRQKRFASASVEWCPPWQDAGTSHSEGAAAESISNPTCVAERQSDPAINAAIGSTARPSRSPGGALKQPSAAVPWSAAINRHLLPQTPHQLRANHLGSDGAIYVTLKSCVRCAPPPPRPPRGFTRRGAYGSHIDAPAVDKTR